MSLTKQHSRGNKFVRLANCKIYLVAFLIGHLYLSGVWFDVPPRMKTNKTCDYKRLDYMIIILSSKINIIEGNLYDHVMDTSSFTLLANINSYEPQNYEENASTSNWIH